MSMRCNLCCETASQTLELDEPVSKTGSNVICRNCGLIYHDPVMSEEEIAEFYRHEYAGEYHDSTEMQLGVAASRLNFLEKHVDSSTLSTTLEIGCARGDFLSEIKKRGAEVRGVEPSIQLSDMAKEKGLDVFTGRYEDLLAAESKYQLICIFHVLEHVRNPVAILKRIRRELKDDGKLFVEVPTIGDCQLSMVFKKIHPITFVKETLIAVLQTAGFTPDAVEQRGYNLRVIASSCEVLRRVDYPDSGQILAKVRQYLSQRRKVVDRVCSILEKLVAQKEIAIYGAGHNTLDLSELFDLKRLDLVGVFDADPAKQGKRLLGLKVQSPLALREFYGGSVIISSYGYQEEIEQQLGYLCSRGVQLIKLYDKEK